MSIYKAAQKTGQKERYVRVHKLVMNSINTWIERGDNEISVRIEDCNQKKYIEKNYK